MNEIEAQKQFIQKRRQHFLSEERNNQFTHAFNQEFIPTYQTWKLSTDLATRFLCRLQADDVWDFLRLNYTAGSPIAELPKMLDDIIDVLEVSTRFWQENKEALKQIGYFSPPMPWFYAEYYLKVLGLISVCYLLQREDLLERLLNVILANAEDGLEPDNTIEDLFYYRFDERDDPGYAQFGEYAALLSEAMRSDDKAEKIQILNTYLKDWYHEMVGMSDSEYQSHLDPEQNGFCGYWSFEAAAITYLDDVDDAEFYQYPYYPKDMVEWAREQRRIHYARQDSALQHPLLLSVGQNAPFSGKYGVDNFSGFERHFQAGDVLPNGQVSGKRDKTGNPIFRKDAIWRLLSRDDGGPTRFTPDELAKY